MTRRLKTGRLKKIMVSVMAGAMALGLSACGGKAEKSSDGKLNIVTTIFPEYDWAREIVGQGENSVDKSVADKAEITMLLDNGVDLHSFQPTAEDITKISTCDVFIYVGGESDKWVDDALKEATNKDMIVIDLMDVLGDSVKEEELVEGMQDEDESEESGPEGSEAVGPMTEDVHSPDGPVVEEDSEDGLTDSFDEAPEVEGAETEVDDHDGDAVVDKEDGEGHHHDDGEIEYDEHVWLSLRNAETIANELAAKFGEADPDNASVYKANADAYNKKLSELDAEYKEVVENGKTDTLLFGDRFPFRYMVEDYGLNYYAAFVGCSAETEASFETIIFLAEKTDELGLGAICTIENSDQKIANTVKENTKSGDQEILTLDSLQSVTSKDVDAGATYLGKMSENLEVLKKALGE